MRWSASPQLCSRSLETKRCATALVPPTALLHDSWTPRTLPFGAKAGSGSATATPSTGRPVARPRP
jgi:hypothetical protein